MGVISSFCDINSMLYMRSTSIKVVKNYVQHGGLLIESMKCITNNATTEMETSVCLQKW